jgi:hypothetical protein
MFKKIIIALLFIIQYCFASAQMIHSVSLDDVKISSSKISENYFEIELDGLINNVEQEGIPVLPSKIVHLSTPLGSKIESIKIINQKIKTIQLKKKLLPFQGKKTTNGIGFNDGFISPQRNIYEHDSFYPENQILNISTGYFDFDNQIVSLEITPFQYNAVTNSLLFLLFI